MASWNSVQLIGNLTRDPQLKYLPNQTEVVEFGMAMNRKYEVQGEKREEVTFVDCAAFGKLAGIINTYCTKGKSIFVSGRLKFDSWDDKNGSGKRSKLSVVVDNMQLLGSREGGGASDDEAPAARTERPSRAPTQKPYSDEQKFQDSDIPF